MVRRARRELHAALHRLAGVRAESPDDLHRSVSRPARRHPDRRHRQALRRLPAAVAAPAARCRRSATGSARRDTTPTTTASGTSRTPISRTRPPANRWPPTTTTVSSTRPRCSATSTPTRSARTASPAGWAPSRTERRMSNSGFRRDPLFADRIVAWLTDRYARRRAGDEAALRPFLLVASFVNPHDIVLFPAWLRRSPLAAVAVDGSAARASRADRRRGSVAPSRPRRSRSARRTTPDTVRRRRSAAATSATRSSTATSTTACTPRSTDRSTGCAARSPRVGPTTPSWSARPITAICSARTAVCTRSGSTCTTRRPGCRSSSPASVSDATHGA